MFWFHVEADYFFIMWGLLLQEIKALYQKIESQIPREIELWYMFDEVN